MKKFFLLKNLMLLLFSLIILSCSREEELANPQSTTSESNKFIRTPDGKIVTEIPKDVFEMIKKDLVSEGKKDLLNELSKKYESSDNKMELISKYANVESNKTTTAVTFTYNGHVENIGWQGWTNLGYMTGTNGQSLRLEGIQFSSSTYFNFQARGYVQNRGWLPYVGLNETVGTSEQRTRMEAIQINVPSTYATNVYYQAYMENNGWMPLVSNNQIAGIMHQSLRMEAFRMYMYIII